MSRDKGKRAEREVAKLLQGVVDKLGSDLVIKRNLMQSRDGGFDIAGVPWLALEVKHQEKLAVAAWWSQTLEQAVGGKLPVLFYRRSREAWRVRMMGHLHVGWSGSTQHSIARPVEISADDFLVYFEQRLRLDCGEKHDSCA